MFAEDQAPVSLSQIEFNQLIEPLGPWGEDQKDLPPIAVAVSGGADSLSLALLASRWRKNIIAFIVDHRLRKSSGQEAIITQKCLTDLSIRSEILILENLSAGSALEERARIARYDALFNACSEKGCVDLLLGHHAGDQAETVLMRIRAGSNADGLAGMASIMEFPNIRLVRPLLSIYPQRLRLTLQQEGISWIEDPSNQDMTIQRNRLRKELSTSWQNSGTVSMLLRRASEEGALRMKKDQEQADLLVQQVQIQPEGFAIISSNSMDARALGAVIRTISGSIYTPLYQSIERLGRRLRPMTIGGTKIQSAGRLGDGWLVLREEAALQSHLNVSQNCIWDQRFRVVIPKDHYKTGIQIGALGDGYKVFANRQALPVALLRTLPSFWDRDTLIAVPHLGVFLQDFIKTWQIIFQPKQSLTQSYLFSSVLKETSFNLI